MSEKAPSEQKDSARTTNDTSDPDTIVAGDDAEIIADGGRLECSDCEEAFDRESTLNAHQYFTGHGEEQ